MRLAPLLAPEAVLPRFCARDKKQALKLLSSQAAQITGLGEREIFALMMEREQAGSTGMGGGVCIPHGRFETLKTPCAIFARMEKPIDFGAADGKPVDLIFMLLTPVAANTEHLKALATISRLLRDRPLCKHLRQAADAKALHGLLVAGDDA